MRRRRPETSLHCAHAHGPCVNAARGDEIEDLRLGRSPTPCLAEHQDPQLPLLQAKGLCDAEGGRESTVFSHCIACCTHALAAISLLDRSLSWRPCSRTNIFVSPSSVQARTGKYLGRR